MSRLLKTLITFISLILINFFTPSPTHAQTINCQSDFESLSPGITYKKIATQQPRDIVIHIAKVNLNYPGIGLFTTPKNYLGHTTSQFRQKYNLSLAINANEWWTHTNLKGLAASSGDIYSKSLAGGSLFVSQAGQAHINKSGKYPDKIWHAITGSHDLLINNQVNPRITACVDPVHCTVIDPRTAIGLTANNQLIIITVDGRQSHSVGATLPELVDMFHSCQAHSAINLDGGGSSTLVAKNRGILNQPSDGTERPVANHLGVCLNNCDDLIPDSAAPTSITSSSSTSSSTSYTPSSPSNLNSPQDPHPLRPNPATQLKQLVPDEKSRRISDPNLTLYCAQRPTAVQEIGLAEPPNPVDLTISGILESNFQYFVTPLLSITDTRKSDYDLRYQEKTQRYLADYLEGRAYYETFAEDPNDPETQHEQEVMNLLGSNLWSAFIPTRLGVFRKLATGIDQDRLRRALIKRAIGQFSLDDNPYGFIPATQQVHNYPVTCWSPNLNQVVGYKNYANTSNPCGSAKTIKLSSFVSGTTPYWAPLPEDFDNYDDYLLAYDAWLLLEGGQTLTNPLTGKPVITEPGKWAKIWPYVPMFTREDTKGFIEVIPEPGVTNLPDATEEVFHPHLARTYEVASAISFQLSPQSSHQPPNEPRLISYWLSPPWNKPKEQPWWFDSDENRPGNWDSLGPVCDPRNNIIISSGDLAHESTIPVSFSQTETINPNQNDNCAVWRTRINPLTNRVERYQDFSNCEIRYSPYYLKTYTPFLHAIMDRLITGPTAVFTQLQPYLGTALSESKNWPAVGNPTEETPFYSFTNGAAEAGYKQSPSQAKFYYKYLGFIHCQKEKILSLLQPFITGQPYTYFSPECLQDKTLDDWQEFLASLSEEQLEELLANLSGVAGVCPEGGEEITSKLARRMKDGIVRLLPNTLGARSDPGRLCITPTMIVIHWSGGWDNEDANDRTYDTLVTRNLACQLGSDADDTTLMQPFYETQVEFPWCASAFNTFSINNEVGGGFVSTTRNPPVDIRFTDKKGHPSRLPPGNPYKPGQKIFPQKSVFDHAVDATCVIMKQYNIPWNQIYGHYHVPGSGAEDPGKKFLETWFIPEVKKKCG